MTHSHLVLARRCSAASLSLLLLALTGHLTGQNQLPEDVVWLNATGRLVALDAFGEPAGQRANTPAIPYSVHRAPDGRLWLPGRNLNSEVLIYNRDGSLHRILRSSGGFQDVAFGAGNEVFTIGSGPGRLDVWSLDGNPVSVGLQALPGVPRAMAIDGLGAVFIVSDNMPAPFLSRRDPVTGALSTVTLPTRGTGPADVLGLPQGGCRIVAAGPNQTSTLLDVASNLQVIRLVDLPISGVEQIDQTADGMLWLSGTGGLYRLPQGSDQPIPILPRNLPSPSRFTIDPDGSLWAQDVGAIWRFDASTGEVDSSRREPGVPEASDRYVRAWVIAPLADDDGDGTPNGVEIQLGTDPYDDQSSALANLSIDRITYRPEELATFELSGLGGVGVLLFAGDYDLSQGPIPGLLGDLRLDLMSLTPVGAPISVPGRLDLRVPDMASTANALLCAQAVVGVAAPRFTNHECTRTVPAFGLTIGDQFSLPTNLQRDRSAARLLPGGFLTTGPIGGTGIHGSFAHTDGRALGNDVFEFDTDSWTIPATRSLFGNELVIRDGRFEFTDFTIPAGVTVRFVGSRPAVVRVAGRAIVDGTLDLNGGDLEEDSHDGKNSTLSAGTFTPGVGQSGTEAGAGGGRGGDGAFACDGTGNPMQPSYNDFDGFDGEDLRVPASHAYAGAAAGTGGSGAALFPPSGDRNQIVYRGFGNNYSINSASGGGGGGFRGAGQDGRVVLGPFITGGAPAMPNEFGAPTPGGSAFPALEPRPAGADSLTHYLVAGSGGGGGASHPLFVQASSFADPFKFLSGAAGTGGGGAVALRVGSDLSVGAQGRIEARGGDGARTTSNSRVTTFGVPSPGGAGSGGSVLLQVGNPSVTQAGQIVVRGGQGGSTGLAGPFYFADVRGGDGAPGSARLELADPNVQAGSIGQVEPAGSGSVGTLTDRDVRTIALLGPYRIQNAAPVVRWRHYEIQAIVDGNPVTYTDASIGFNPANVDGAPVRAFFRAVSRPGVPDDAWRDFVNPEAGASISDDLAIQVEVLLVFDRSIASDIRIDSLELEYWQ